MWGEVGTGNRGATNYNGWFTYPWSGHGRQAGFSYRGSIDGERNDTSYLWEYNTENSALPFTQLFVRPTLTTTVPNPIADEGLPAQVLAPLLDDRPEEIAGGVVGLNSLGDSEPALRAPVLDITSRGDVVFVGGKFSQVRDTATGRARRPLLPCGVRPTDRSVDPVVSAATRRHGVGPRGSGWSPHRGGSVHQRQRRRRNPGSCCARPGQRRRRPDLACVADGQWHHFAAGHVLD